MGIFPAGGTTCHALAKLTNSYARAFQVPNRATSTARLVEKKRKKENKVTEYYDIGPEGQRTKLLGPSPHPFHPPAPLPPEIYKERN